MRRFAASAALVATLAIAACDGNGGKPTPTPAASPSATQATSTATQPASTTAAPASPTPAPPTPTPSPAVTPTPTPALPPFQPATTVFQREPAPNIGQPSLKTVRAASNLANYDRIVFEFNERLPGYEVKYINTVEQCASGETVALKGGAKVRVQFRPATAHDDGGPTVDTPIIEATLVRLLEARISCDFEGIVAYGVGLTAARPFRVFELQNPPRLVIDFQH